MDGAPDSDEQVVLEELYDENYEPTESEILEYAKWLGMDTDNEKELLWIATAGLKEPVPEGWKPCQAPSKEIYYFNFITGESIWDHPCDDRFRKLYAHEKERRRLAAGQQRDEQSPDQHEAQWQDQQQGAQQEQLPRVPPLVLPSDNTVQHTAVEIPLPSPSGTLSTIASATTVSVAESPVGGLAQGTSAMNMGPTQQQVARPSAANNQADVDAAMLQQPPGSAAPGPAVARMTGGSDGGSSDAAMAAAVGWQAEAAAADQQERLQFRQHLDDERRLWEQHMEVELHEQHAALHEQHRQRLWALTQELQGQERLAATQLKAEQDARLTALRAELQATLGGLEHELQDAKAQHASHMQQLRRQHADVEGRASSMLQQAQQRLSQTALTDSELSAARDKVAAAAELEALAEAAGHRSELLQSALHQVEQELSVEVSAYKATRRAEALKQLAEHLSEDTTAAAQQLEKHTAELQRLEAAVADRAAVLQKLDEELASKQQQLSLTRSVDHCGEGQLLSSCKEQLAAVQQQLLHGEKQLGAADATLVEKRAAVAEVEEQLAAFRREMSVCEPRLGSLRQQLQEVEANIRTREAEHQQRQADVALSTKRLQDLREEVTRRQAQLESVEALYTARQDTLRQTSSELARRRGELSTLESSLSESLRRKADAEFQSLEEQLRRTRKAAADAASELSARQLALAEANSQLTSKQLQLEGVEASLASKSKELADVLAQLQAAAAQEFQDAKKLLLEEEARLLGSERRSMQLRVADQVESEMRAALAAGRRRIERDLSAQLAEQHAASAEHQQRQVKQWLDAAGAGVAPCVSSFQGVSGSSPRASGKRDSAVHGLAAVAAAAAATAAAGQVPSVAVVTTDNSSVVQPPLEELQPRTGTGPSSVRSMPDTNTVEHDGDAGQLAPLSPGAPVPTNNSRRRARSCSPVHQRQQQVDAGRPNLAAKAPPSRAYQLQSGSVSQGVRDAAVRSDASLASPGAVQHSEPAQQAAAAAAGAGVAAGLQAAAAAVVNQLRALGGDSATSSSWCDLLESDPESSSGPLSSMQVAGSRPQLSAYSSLLQHAKQFIKQRRRDIQARQGAIMAAQADWKAVLAAMEDTQRVQQQSGAAVPPELTQAVQQLRQLKGVLQDQIHTLNDETQQVKGLKARVQQLKATIDLLQLHTQQREQPEPTINTLSSLLSSLSGLQAKQQQWQQQQQQRQRQSSSMLSSPWGPLQQHNQHQQQQTFSSMSAPSPLDKVTAALQAALDAATSCQAEPQARDTGLAGSLAAHSSSRRVGLQPWPNGVAALKPQQHVHQNGQRRPDLMAESSWDTLSKLREERGAAQHAMQQHSQWLQGFREQVAQVAALQPAVATKLQQHRHVSPQAFVSVPQPKQAAAADLAAAGSAGGSGGLGDAGGWSGVSALSPVASSALLAVASTGSLGVGQPVTVDLGGDQELIISVVHKGAAI